MPETIIQTTTEVEGYTVYTLRSEVLELQVVPGMGAKITSLRSLRSGREWLWRAFSPLRYFANQAGDAFGDSPLVGVDECIPTVGECEWKGRRISDHGEVWFLPWELDGEAWSRGAILTRAQMGASPFLFERSIRLESGTIQFDYRLTNQGSEAETFVWAIHPLFTIEPGDRIELPEEVNAMRVEGATGLAGLESGSWVKWPEPAPGIQLGDLDRFGDQCACKLFSGVLSEGRAVITNSRRRERLVFLWNVEENPAVGVWICKGTWNNYYQMAVEPTNVPAESLSEAEARGAEFPLVEPGQSVRWQLRLCLETF